MQKEAALLNLEIFTLTTLLTLLLLVFNFI